MTLERALDFLQQQPVVGVIGFVFFWLAAQLASWLARRALQRRGSNPDTILLIPRLVFFGLLALGIAVLVSGVFRQPSFAFNSVLIASLIAGLGLQDLVKNYVSGFYLLFEGNLKVGDHIRTESFSGEVTDVRLRVTYLKGEDGSLIVAPNSELFNKTVQINDPAPRPRRGRRV